MKISEIIKKLEDHKKEIGDCDMEIAGGDKYGHVEYYPSFEIIDYPGNGVFSITGVDVE